MSTERERLLSLIEFAQHSARLKHSVTQDIANHKLFYRFEHDLIGLPGINFNSGGDHEELWLTIDRLVETKAPIPKDKLLSLWLDASNNPEVEPKLKLAVEMVDESESEYKKNLVLLSDLPQKNEIEQKLERYVDQEWSTWAAEERKRRRTIKIYSELFTIKQQLEGSISEAPVELVWGIGMGIWKSEKFKIRYPLLTKLVELSLNEKDMTIEVRPRETEIRLESDVYMSIDNPGITDLENAFKDFQSKQTQVFSPFDRISYECHLQNAATHLDPNGIYWPSQTKVEDRTLPDIGEELKITDTWVLFTRPRSKSLFIQDLENFKTQILDQKDESIIIGGVAEELVKDPKVEHQELNIPNFRGLSSMGMSSDGGAGDVQDLYFPLPFNEEQVNIIQRLECSKGVVVQGPPGTGKTHSIANIIAHYMANGKRVLVTSMKETALSVLKEKLPSSIQPLAISILTNDQDGMKQFEFAVSKMAQELQTIDRKSLSKEINKDEISINQLHAKLSSIDRSIAEWAKNNIKPFMCDGKAIYPEDAAREVRSATGQYEWLDEDISISPEHDLKIDNNDLIVLRDARKAVGTDINYINENIPDIDIFPDVTELFQLHTDLRQERNIKQLLKNENYPILANKSDEIFFQIEEVLKLISRLEKFNDEISPENLNWTHSVKEILKKTKENTIIVIFESLINEVVQCLAERSGFLASPVILPPEFDFNEELISAVLNKSKGKSAFGFGGILGKGKHKKILGDIRIINKKPMSKDDWVYINNYVIHQCRIKEIIIRWNGLSDQILIPKLDLNQLEHSISKASAIIDLYASIKEIISIEKSICRIAKIIFPDWLRVAYIIDDLGVSNRFKEAINYYICCRKLSYAKEAKKCLSEKLNKYTGKISKDIISFISQIGLFEISDSLFQKEWSLLMSELNRVLSLRYHFINIKTICERIMESGAKNWAKKLISEPMLSETDNLLPGNFHQSWRYRRLESHLMKSNCFSEFKKLTSQRSEVEKILSKTYQVLIAKRTWLKLANNATPDIRAALQAFQEAIARIGKGTGKRAVRYRSDARNAASLTNKAIPCWIMPHYRVCESLPSEYGCFDLVIIDEASQSDLNALPAMLRANKLLIVGDDKQVSPDGLGLEEEKIKSLMTRFLSSQVGIYKQAMSPDRSIYDLCKIVFADSQVMLREHFRCVAPIIEYSKREFYHHELKPLRLPTRSERLDPPLIDVFIEDGYRRNKVNEAEARFIVDEIKKICDDPGMGNRTIGVVSLLGYEQSRKIWEMIQNEISVEIQTRHKIKCGDALTFQGEQRSIIFLSMVVTRDNNKANSREAFSQRFNVAASRAKDRMYLVRSVTIEDLSPADKLRRKLIDHFTSPFAQDEVEIDNFRDLCESPFEREIFDLLTERGYRVTPQVSVGTYRIDMVVEGHGDIRLAIECDGDRYHDASKWDEDMNRQRILERAGWVFWRCFASTFALNRENVVADLINTLNQMGIEPIGAEGVVNNIYTEYRSIKVYKDLIVSRDSNDEELMVGNG